MKCKLKYASVDEFGYPINSKANPKDKNLMGQDVFIYENFFPNYGKGCFLDIGAACGVVRSNSYFFEKELNWSGICVEAQEHLFKQLKNSRDCLCIHACISDTSEEVDFLSFENGGDFVGGIIKHYPEAHEDRYLRQWQQNSKKLVVNTHTVESLLGKHKINEVDYLSIDTEGSDFIILKSINLRGLNVKCISIENIYHDDRIREHCQNLGYEFVQRFRRDDVYVNKDYAKKIGFM